MQKQLQTQKDGLPSLFTALRGMDECSDKKDGECWLAGVSR